MAAIVLVHGIKQSQYSADQLEQKWLPALAGGVRIAGHPNLADRLWRGSRPGDLETRMAFYGNLYLDPNAQGTTPGSDLDEQQQQLTDQLALAWLTAASERAADTGDRREATRQILELTESIDGAQGDRKLLRSAAQGLARLKWFAPKGFSVAERFINTSLTEVTRYLTDETIREQAQQQILALIGPETRIVIAHSLGSVVAYEALHRSTQALTLVTLGSPLALQNIIYPKLRPQPTTVPATLTHWYNIAARDDLVATFQDFDRYFLPAAGQTLTPNTRIIDNGSQPHDATHYLSKRSLGTITAQSLATSLATD
ncbi:hypothetical protein VMT65_12170 [Nocardia sp. CDC153]|uniref:hypothetical protein n=1 Tax=Nocardia sp. CDC153 TaxID=3112167 RepID=UPI002DBE2260|nr:hypothetical protein [Nocardia sp. CDC153]MEC3953786.1 hypothetical protein [Nocardia sp. CDC153]